MMNIFSRKGSLESGKEADINILDDKFNVVISFFRGLPGFIDQNINNQFPEINSLLVRKFT